MPSWISRLVQIIYITCVILISMCLYHRGDLMLVVLVFYTFYLGLFWTFLPVLSWYAYFACLLVYFTSPR